MSDGNQVKIDDLVAAAQEAERKKDWTLALRHCDTALATLPDHRLIHSLAPIRGRALINLGRHAEADAIFQSLIEAAPDRPTGFVGLAQVAQAQGDWSLAMQRWDSCIESFPNSPQNQRWRGWRARTLEASGAWQEAFDSWVALVEACDGDREALVGRARSFVKLQRPLAETEHFIAEALKSFPQDPGALRMYAGVARDQDNARLSLGRWMDYIALQPKADLDAYRRAIYYAIRCADSQAATCVIDLTPPQLAATTAYRCRVLLLFHDFQGDVEAALALLRVVQSGEIDWRDAAAISDFLIKIIRPEEALTFLATVLDRFDDKPLLLRNYLQAVYSSRGPERLEAEKARLREKLGDEIVAQVFSIVPKSWLTRSELALAIDHQLKSLDMNSKAIFAVLHIIDTNDRNVMELISERLAAHAGPYVGIVQRILKSKIVDAQRVTAGAAGEAGWEAFEAESRSLAADLDELVRQQIRAAMSADAPGNAAFAEAVFALQRIEARAGAAWLNSSASYYDAAAFAGWLGNRIARREPTSVVRLGDGEGNFLPYSAAQADYQCRDQSDIQQQMWGEEFISRSEARRFADELASVALRADAVGLSTMNRLLKLYSRARPALPRVVRGWHNVLHFADTLDPEILANKVVVSNNLHSDLNGWDLYRQVLQPTLTVSTVSCHDLSAALAEQFGLSVRSWHRLPAQKKHLGMFGHENVQAAERLYPDIFNRIMAEIDPEPGEIFLVAAGILGKFMCDRVRAKGGITLDIGSLADYWMGFSTREYGGAQLTLDAPSP